MTTKARNDAVDLLRGIAMILVVLGHTMTGSTTGAEDTLLFNFIWSVQMPLFFIISGYVTKYSRPVTDLRQLADRIGKRTRAYLLPWVVWTFLIRGLLLGETAYFDLGYFLWHMDAGYWYLISLWTISVIFIMAQYIARGAQRRKYWLLLGGSYGAGMVVLLCIGLSAGLSFWNIKLTLYYMLFYILGVGLGAWETYIPKCGSVWWKNTIIMVAAIPYGWILWNVNLYTVSDGISGIVMRMIAAVLGCFLIWQMSRYIQKGKLSVMTDWIGKNSMGIYLSHYVFLRFLPWKCACSVNTAEGLACMIGNFVFVILLSAMLSWLLNKNQILRRLCLGK